MPSIYKLTAVRGSTAETNGGGMHYGFSVTGVIGKPLVSFSYDTREAAEKAREQMNDAVSQALQSYRCSCVDD
jgi:hydroxymethylglutaryl-CoA reductase